MTSPLFSGPVSAVTNLVYCPSRSKSNDSSSQRDIRPSSTFELPGIPGKLAWDIAALLIEIDGVDPQDPITADSQALLLNIVKFLNASSRDFRIEVANKS